AAARVEGQRMRTHEFSWAGASLAVGPNELSIARQPHDAIAVLLRRGASRNVAIRHENIAIRCDRARGRPDEGVWTRLRHPRLAHRLQHLAVLIELEQLESL